MNTFCGQEHQNHQRKVQTVTWNGQLGRVCGFFLQFDRSTSTTDLMIERVGNSFVAIVELKTMFSKLNFVKNTSYTKRTCFAMIFASSVLPHPEGPCRTIPRGSLNRARVLLLMLLD